MNHPAASCEVSHFRGFIDFIEASFEEYNPGDKNSVSLGRNIGDSGLGCQGRTWHIMLGTRVFRWTGVFLAGLVRGERKGEQARDLPAFAESPVRNGGDECEKGIHRSLLTAIASAAGVGEGGSASAGSAEDVKMLRAAARGASLRDGVVSEKRRRSPSSSWGTPWMVHRAARWMAPIRPHLPSSVDPDPAPTAGL